MEIDKIIEKRIKALKEIHASNRIEGAVFGTEKAVETCFQWLF